MHQKAWKRFIPVLFCFISCEKAISFKTVTEDPKLVVEATIESGKYPLVYLTTSLDFFSRISIQTLTSSFVHNAEVWISDGTTTQKLREYIADVQGYSLSYYTADSTSGTAFTGEFGKGYSLKIVYDGKEYTSTTTIPRLTKQIKSLYYETDVDQKDSTKVSLFARFEDPPGLGNYIRYFTSVDHGPFYPGLNSVFDDQVVDGKAYSIAVSQGVDRNSDFDSDEYGFFHRGDTVTVKLCDIDKATYDFWRTMEYTYSSIGNPFSSPTKVIGNISNDALGYFGGYAVQYASIIIAE